MSKHTQKMESLRKERLLTKLVTDFTDGLNSDLSKLRTLEERIEYYINKIYILRKTNTPLVLGDVSVPVPMLLEMFKRKISNHSGPSVWNTIIDNVNIKLLADKEDQVIDRDVNEVLKSKEPAPPESDEKPFKI